MSKAVAAQQALIEAVGDQDDPGLLRHLEHNLERYRGGLMYWADGIGMKNIRDQMREWETRYGDRWTPAKLIEDLAASGKGFLDD